MFSIQKVTAIVFISLGLSTTTPPQLAATTKDNIELVTALLRGYAAYSEYELRNDTSRSAHVKRALIHAVRLINDICACKRLYNAIIVSDPVFVCYDSFQIAKNLHACLKNAQPHAAQTSPEPIIDGHEYEKFRRFVLPAIEMLGALARTRLILSGGEVVFLADIARYLQRIYAAPKNSARLKIWAAFMMLHRLVSILKLVTLSDPDMLADWLDDWLEAPEAPQAQNVFQAMLADNRAPAVAINDSSDQCSVCYDHGKSHALNCGHAFCHGCLRSWLVGQAKDSCPLCRAHVQSIYRIPQFQACQLL
ncbi:MAG: RING-HC finger protein [Candidatus Babeliales bacterium]|jgi:hypothetical protein